MHLHRERKDGAGGGSGSFKDGDATAWRKVVVVGERPNGPTGLHLFDSHMPLYYIYYARSHCKKMRALNHSDLDCYLFFPRLPFFFSTLKYYSSLIVDLRVQVLGESTEAKIIRSGFSRLIPPIQPPKH